jgi:hypothetical protein
MQCQRCVSIEREREKEKRRERREREKREREERNEERLTPRADQGLDESDGVVLLPVSAAKVV